MERTPSAVVVLDRAVRSREGLDAALVQQTLDEIFQSVPFRSSRQSQHLLRYIVDQSLAGHTELLKERLIGVNVFGRLPDYDSNEDPIVRARAAEVRKRLAQFYQGEGTNSAIRIGINPGSYLASFTERPKGSPSDIRVPASFGSREDQISHVSQEEARPALQKASRTGRWAKLAVLVFLAACLGGFLRLQLRPAAPIEKFWEPVVKGTSPVLIYSGANAVYMLSSDFMNRYEATHTLDPLQNQGREFVVPMSSDMKIEPVDLLGFKNDFVTLGDLSANVRVASLLALHHRRFDLRTGEDIAFSDLRQSPSVLIGAFNNSWTLELTGDLPFVFDRNLTIKNQLNKKQTWTPVYAKERKITMDYAVVTRMPRSKTGEALVAIAGITQSGTRAAAEYITDPGQIKGLIGLAPTDWAQKNLQFVLQTKVVNDIPTSPVVVALKSW